MFKTKKNCLRLVAVLLLAFSALSCGGRARLKIDVVKNGPNIEVHFGYCDGRKDDPLVFLAEVVRMEQERRLQWCAVGTKSLGLSVGRLWIYGEEVSGGATEDCKQLESGEYFVAAQGGGHGRGAGRAYFAVDRSGNVSMRKNSCN